MIEEFFGFKRHPFTNTVDLNFLFWAKKFREGYARLLYSILESRGGVSLILGDVGCGKTTLCYALKKDIEEKNKRVALIETPFISPYQLLREIAEQFWGTKKRPRSKIAIYKELKENLIGDYPNFSYSVLIDESQLLPLKTLRELRLLLNLETPKGKLLQMVLFGQPELKKKLNRYSSFRQRIGIAYYLTPFDKSETISYIKHRLEKAGGKNDLFDLKALNRIHSFTQGCPRLINTLCSNSLFAAFTFEKKKIDVKLVKLVIKDYIENIGTPL